MKKKPRRKFFVVAAVLLVGLGWIFRPYESPEESKLLPELQSLEEPLQVKSIFWSDGGSLGVLITDNAGRTVKYCLPHSKGEGRDQYLGLFSGALHYQEVGAIEIDDPYHSRLRILEILREAPSKDMDRDRIIATISERWRDWATLYYRSFKDDEYYDW